MATGRDLAAWLLQNINGHPYVFGATGPRAYDCSGALYAASGALQIPNGRAHRTAESLYEWCRASGTLISPADAEGIIGAWGFVKHPRSYVHHVVTSLGNGSTVEAANKKAGCGVFKWGGRPDYFDFAGLCPGLTWTTPPPVVAPPIPTPSLQDVINLCRVHAKLRPFQLGDGTFNQLTAGINLIRHALIVSGIAWNAPIPATGDYDHYLAQCVQWYQHVHNLNEGLATSAVDLNTFNTMYPV